MVVFGVAKSARLFVRVWGRCGKTSRPLGTEVSLSDDDVFFAWSCQAAIETLPSAKFRAEKLGTIIQRKF